MVYEIAVGQELVGAVNHLSDVGQQLFAGCRRGCGSLGGTVSSRGTISSSGAISSRGGARLGGHGAEEPQHVEMAEGAQRQGFALDQVVVGG